MLGFIKKEFYNWLKNLVPSLISIVMIVVTYFLLTGYNSLIIVGGTYIGSCIIASARSDHYTGWDKFAATTPLPKETLAKSKYVLYAIVTVISIFVFTIFSIGVDALLFTITNDYYMMDEDVMVFLISLAFSIAFTSAAINFPGSYILSPKKSSIIQSVSTIVLLLVYYLANSLIFGNETQEFNQAIKYAFLIIAVNLIFYILSWFVTRRIVRKKEY